MQPASLLLLLVFFGAIGIFLFIFAASTITAFENYTNASLGAVPLYLAGAIALITLLIFISRKLKPA